MVPSHPSLLVPVVPSSASLPSAHALASLAPAGTVEAPAPTHFIAPTEASQALIHAPNVLSTSANIPLSAPASTVSVPLGLVALQSLPSASSLAAPSATSSNPVKSLALLCSAGSQAQAQAQACRDGGDRGQKHGDVPSSAPILSAPTGTPLNSALPSRSTSVQECISSSACAGGQSKSAGASSVAGAAAVSAAAPLALAPPPHPTAPTHTLAPASSSSASAACAHTHDASAPHVAGVDARAVSSAPLLPDTPLAALTSALAAAFAKGKHDSSRSAAHDAQHYTAPAVASDAMQVDADDAPEAAVASSIARWNLGQPACCLVLDASRLPAGEPAALAHLHALLAVPTTDVATSLAMVRAWLPQLTHTLRHVLAEPAHGRLHLEFHDHSDLAAALAATPALVRCGTLPTPVAWRQSAPLVCGPQRHEVPELLQLSCTPTEQRELQHLQPAIAELLRDMSLEHTSHWFPSSHDPRRVGTGRLVVNVLPRAADEASLAALISRVHEKYRLWGGLVAVHAPKMPSLSRCSECGTLGHGSRTCPAYRGLAIRLLFRHPVTAHRMHTLQAGLGARACFLGNGVSRVQPHRKVTMLFDVDCRSAKALAPLQTMLLQLSRDGASALELPPHPVDVNRRMQECRECGASDREHVCPFALTPALAKLRGGPEAQQPAARPPLLAAAGPAPNGAGSAARGSAPAARAPGDKMCGSWRNIKTCLRRNRGQRCSFEHPPDHSPAAQCCNQFLKSGQCQYGSTCKFAHVASVAEVAQAPSQAQAGAVAPVPAPAPAHAARAAAAVPAPAAAAPSSAPAPAPAPAPVPASAPMPAPASLAAAVQVQGSAAAPAASASEAADGFQLQKNKTRARGKRPATDLESAEPSGKIGQPSSFAALGALMEEDSDPAASAHSTRTGGSPPRRTISSLSTLASPTKDACTEGRKKQKSSDAPTRTAATRTAPQDPGRGRTAAASKRTNSPSDSSSSASHRATASPSRSGSSTHQ